MTRSNMTYSRRYSLLCGIAGTLLGASVASGQSPQLPERKIVDGTALLERVAAKQMVAKDQALADGLASLRQARDYLMSTQHESGGWGVREGAPVFPAITGLALSGLVDLPGEAADAERTKAVERAVDFILSHQQPDGSIYDRILPSYNTAICVSALSKVNLPRAREAMLKGREFLRGLQYGEGAVELAQLGEENAKPVPMSDPFYGGVGYGRHGRPDLSNTAFWVQALRDSGVDSGDPAYQRALVFLQRLQMSESHAGVKINERPYAQGSKQGGFIYATSINKNQVGTGQSFAGDVSESLSGPPGVVAFVTLAAKGPDDKPVLLAREDIQERLEREIKGSTEPAITGIGKDLQVLMGPGEASGSRTFEIRARCENAQAFLPVVQMAFADKLDLATHVRVQPAESWQAQSRLRAYGSMTYAGFKSLLYAGLTKNDPRVLAAFEWIRQNYTLAENPGVGTDGQYYYYLVFARAMYAYGAAVIPVPDGQPSVGSESQWTRDWRVDLIGQLKGLQSADGSFRSVDDRWMESDSVLITAYSAVALHQAVADLSVKK